jgi:hypothetical protein
MTDKEIEDLTMYEMRELINRLTKARYRRARELWTEINGKTRTTSVSNFIKFRDQQERLGK